MRLSVATAIAAAAIGPSAAFSFSAWPKPFAPRTPSLLRSTAPSATDHDEAEVMKKLDDIAHKLKLQVFDLDEGIYGFESKDHRYGIEVVQTEIKTEPSLGLELTEVARGTDGRGLVLISRVGGNAASSRARVGDVITGVFAREGHTFAERTTGLNYDLTVEVIQKGREAGGGTVTLELDRLVERAKVRVEVEGLPAEEGGPVAIEALAGENLRTLLIRKHVRLYDPKTKRFDMPYATGDCAGEGICGTCLVKVLQGAESLSPQSDLEKLITKGRPASWRAACRAVVGADNKEGTVKVHIHPQSNFPDELNPGVKSVRVDQ